MEEYTPNSKKYHDAQKNKEKKAEEKKPEIRPIQNTVVKKETTFGKIKKAFISEDAQNLKDWFFQDVLVPVVKKTIMDSVDIVLNGQTGRGSRNSSRNADRPYTSYYRKSEDRYADDTSSRRWAYQDVIIPAREDADDVLSQLDDILDNYPQVRVSDLNDILNVSGQYTDNRYGWTNIRSAEVVSVRGGYMIRMPRPKALD